MNRVVKPCWVASECIVLCNAAIGGPSSTGCTDLVSLEVVDVTKHSISQLFERTDREGWWEHAQYLLRPLGKARDLS